MKNDKIGILAALMAVVCAVLFLTAAKPAVRAAAAPVATTAGSMTVMEVETGRVLYEYDAETHRPMASTTKVLTAIVALEQAKLGDVVTVDRRAQGVDGSSVYLKAGEKMTVEDLLYCLMLQSGNDAAEALAYHIAGSLPAFAAIMNATAEKIGAVNSHFVTPHGLHDPDHYTTAHDLALISAYGLRNPEFRKIVGCKSHKVDRAEGSYPIVIVNKNKLLSSYEGATGVKTGYTKAAGRCLVASSERNGLHVVSVVLNCGPMFEECSALMSRAHDEYKMVEILPAYTHIGKLDTVGAMLGGVNVYSKEAFSYPLRDDECAGIFCRIELPENVQAPLPANSEIGKIKIYNGNQLLFATKIYTIEEVAKIDFKDNLELIVNNWLRRA